MLTGTESEAAAYEFTTLTCIPGVIHYNGSKIQLLDLPGIIEGAAQGKGRGREVRGFGGGLRQGAVRWGTGEHSRGVVAAHVWELDKSRTAPWVPPSGDRVCQVVGSDPDGAGRVKALEPLRDPHAGAREHGHPPQPQAPGHLLQEEEDRGAHHQQPSAAQEGDEVQTVLFGLCFCKLELFSDTAV